MNFFWLWTFIACEQPAQIRLYISEFMSHNTVTHATDEGEYFDWIELHNGGTEPINLDGFGLSDNSKKPSKWTFPYIVVNPNERLLVYASNENRTDPSTALHTNFQLKRKGEELVLTDNHGNTLQSIAPVLLWSDISWGSLGHGQPGGYFTTPTPSETNDPGIVWQVESLHNSSLQITEIQLGKSSVVIDEDGELTDWVELYNPTDQLINVKGYGLSDQLNTPFRWRFPDVDIQPKSHLLVYLSGKARGMHTNFKVNQQESVGLFSPFGQTIDIISTIREYQIGSHGRYEGKWQYLRTPTPRSTNLPPHHGDSQLLYINEVMAEDDLSPFKSDWLELYNDSSKPIQLSGYSLSTKAKVAAQWIFPSLTIGAKDYALVFLDQKNCAPPKCDGFHANFKLSPRGEEIFLRAPDHTIVDRFSTGVLTAGISAGLNDDKQRVLYDTPSPGKVNSKTHFAAYAKAPKVSHKSGFYEKDVTVTVATGEQEVYYTTDGRLPTRKSTKYSAPIAISKTTHLRVKAFRKGLLPSPEAQAFFFIGAPHVFPVMSLAVDPVRMFDKSIGMYQLGPYSGAEYPHFGANFWSRTRELPTSFVLLNEQGNLLYESFGGLKIFGGYSRAEVKKGFRLIARSKYGASDFLYPFIPNRSRERYGSIVIRASGQDMRRTSIMDVLVTRMTADLDLDQQSHQPIILYINGSYWGIYNFREKVNQRYLAHKYNYPEQSITILEHSDISRDFQHLLDELRSRSPDSAQDYLWIQTVVDTDSVRDWMLTQLFTANQDIGNIRIWKSSVEGSRWKYLLFDSDLSFLVPKFNTLAYILSKGRKIQYPHQRISGWLVENEEFRSDLHKRAMFFYHELFSVETFQSHLSAIKEMYGPEIKRDRERWNISLKYWERRVKEAEKKYHQRRKLIRPMLKKLLQIDQKTLDRDFPVDKPNAQK